jgi:hypothetical protein
MGEGQHRGRHELDGDGYTRASAGFGALVGMVTVTE